MTTQAELTVALAAVTNQVTKIGTETEAVLTKIVELESVIAAGGTLSDEVTAALEALKAQVQVVDDLVADAPMAV